MGRQTPGDGKTPGEYGPDALPVLASALDAILEEVRGALDDYLKSKDRVGVVHPPSIANKPNAQPR